MVLSAIIGTIGKLAGGWLSDRAEIKKAKVKAKIKEIETTNKANKTADELAMKNMEKSWKDELILIVFMTPLVLAFVPSCQEIVRQGFMAIEATPDWYKLLVVGMVATVMGLRWIVQPMIAALMQKLK